VNLLHVRNHARLTQVRDLKRRGLPSSPVQPDAICADLRRILVTGLVSRMNLVASLGGSFLAHAAPATTVQLLLGSNGTAPIVRRRQCRRKQRITDAPLVLPVTQHSHGTRQSVTGRPKRDLTRRARQAADIYAFEDLNDPSLDYIQLQSSRWGLVKQVASAWSCFLPDPGHCYFITGPKHE
jgi:hypothetical protein